MGKNTIDKNKNRIVWLILMLLVMTFIFVMSNQDGDTSGRIGNYVAKLLSIYSNNANIDASHTPLLFGLNLRKWAHVIVFALLGMTVVGLTKSVQKSIVICYIFAILDEVHQYFILGRTAKISDTFIDALGFLSIIMAWWILMRLKDIFKSF